MRTPGKCLLSPPPDDRLVTRRESVQQKHCLGVHTRKKDWTHLCDCCNANARTVLLADHDTRDGWVASRWVGCIKIGGMGGTQQRAVQLCDRPPILVCRGAWVALTRDRRV